MNLNKKEFIYSNSEGQNITTELFHIVFDNFSDLAATLDNEFVDIVHADATYDLTATKIEIKKLLETKPLNQKYGSVAEFFAHIVLRKLGYTQECLFKNLEESSMKKGFDGLYENAGKFWLMESKSAYTSSKHKNKIYDAITGLQDKIEKIQTNNPWMNAVNHILVLQNGNTNESLKNQIRELSQEYIKGITHKIKEFRIIPVSTLFIKNTQSLDEIISSIQSLLNGQEYQAIKIICIDHYVYNEFMNYLEI